LKLDIGCGENKQSGFSGVDIRALKNVDYIMNICNLQFPDNSIDEVYSRRCVQHIQDDNKALNEVYRVLKSNGKFTLIVASFTGWFYYKLGFSPSHYDVFHLYSDSKIRKKMGEIGFRDISISHIKTRSLSYDIKAVGIK
jgi:ubiquinone/menaquinone biosynthesis C-methylase UbiE